MFFFVLDLVLTYQSSVSGSANSLPIHRSPNLGGIYIFSFLPESFFQLETFGLQVSQLQSPVTAWLCQGSECISVEILVYLFVLLF